jgi:hypothetical protein
VPSADGGGGTPLVYVVEEDGNEGEDSVPGGLPMTRSFMRRPARGRN